LKLIFCRSYKNGRMEILSYTAQYIGLGIRGWSWVGLGVCLGIGGGAG